MRSPSDVPAHEAPVTLATLAAVLGVATQHPDQPVLGVTLDSRAVRPGDLFAAVPGATVHRAQFVAIAAQAGAVAILTDGAGAADAAATGLPVLVVDRPRAQLGAVAAAVYHQPAAHLLMLGVTGTNGKTTTAYLLEAGLQAAGRNTGLIGTILTRIGDRELPSERTTPDAPELQALLATMVAEQVDAVAMEVSSHALSLGRVDGLVFDVGLFLNLGSDHLDFHHDTESYFAAKASLFTPGRSRAGVVNVDDPYGRRLADGATVPITTFSAAGDSAADWRAADVRVEADGSTFTAVGPSDRVEVTVALPGRFNVDNALGALVTLVTAGVDRADAARGIGSCPGVPGRMERVDEGQDFTALVDYAHTPEALATLLGTVRQLTTGRVLLVFGCGGDRDQAKRPVMGAIAARDADVVVVTDDNPRTEDPAAIRAAVVIGAVDAATASGVEVLEIGDRAVAIDTAVDAAMPGDCLVVAGKGHETTQDVGHRVLSFDDRAVLRAAIARRA